MNVLNQIVKPRSLTKVTFVNGKLPFNTPALCSRDTGECFIDGHWFFSLPEDHRVFILLHENEHLVQQTSDEKKVDEGAFYKYAKMGRPLTESIYALTKTLHFNNPEHIERALLQMERAAKYDAEVNGNEKPLKYLSFNTNNMFLNDEKGGTMNIIDDANYESIFGLSKGEKQKKAAKASKKEAEGQSKLLEAQAKLELAKQGIASPGKFAGAGDVLKSLGGLAANFIPGAGALGALGDAGADPNAGRTANPNAPAPDAEKGGFPMWAIILIVVVVLAIIAALIIRAKKKKKAASGSN